MLDQTTIVLHCSVCGVEASVACKCGAPYVTAGVRAAAAVAKTPEKSDRAIAEEIGVGSNTVRRARSTAPHGAVNDEHASNGSTAPHGAVEKRTGKDGRTRSVPRKKPTGVVQRQAAIDVKPGVWDAFKAQAETEGISAAAKLGKMITHTVSKSKPENPAEIMVSIHVLIEKLVPLFERVRTESKKHVGLICQPELLLVASEGRRLLDQWASSDKSVRRVRGHVASKKPPANTMKGVP